MAPRSFGVSPTTPARFDLTRLVPELEALHLRLAGVVIECLPFAELLRRYDRPTTLFYLDPPYWGCEGDYGPLFARSDFEVLADQLARLKGRFLLSLNDVPEVRATFKRFKIERVETTYTLGVQAAQRVGEVLIGA